MISGYIIHSINDNLIKHIICETRQFYINRKMLNLSRLFPTTLARAVSLQPARQLYVISKADHDKLLDLAKLSDAKYKLALADMENLRQRLNKQVDDAKQFAITGFCKDLVEVTDVFEIAMKQITPESVGQTNFEGISMIEQRILAIFKKHGLISLNPKGSKFDPNEHQAVFETTDPSLEPGTVSEVCKVGWKLNERVIRPAVVGVNKRPS